ncbi:MAG: hypothetical protein V4550_09520 [Gemmatimonadota bacterium]
MNQYQQRHIDALRRVEYLIHDRAELLGTIATSRASLRLSTAIVRVEELGRVQGSADRYLAGQRSRELAATIDLKVQHMRPISTFAKACLNGAPDFAALTLSTREVVGPHLVRAARTMASAALPHADALTDGGFPPDTIAQLRAAADQLEAALLARANTKVARAAATHGIQQILNSAAEAVSILHALVTRQFAKDPTFFAVWNAARRIHAKPGAVRAASEAVAPPHLSISEAA